MGERKIIKDVSLYLEVKDVGPLETSQAYKWRALSFASVQGNEFITLMVIGVKRRRRHATGGVGVPSRGLCRHSNSDGLPLKDVNASFSGAVILVCSRNLIF